MNCKPEWGNPRWGDWANFPDPIPEDQICKTVESEVVIVGAGIAGVTAALRAAQNGAKVIILAFAFFVGRHYIYPALHHFLQAAALLYAQLIAGKVLRNTAGKRFQRFSQITCRHSGDKAENEVEGDVFKTGFSEHSVCRDGFCCIVAPSHSLQNGISKALHTHTYSVHTQPLEAFGIFLPVFYDVIRVDFNGEFFKMASLPEVSG